MNLRGKPSVGTDIPDDTSHKVVDGAPACSSYGRVANMWEDSVRNTVSAVIVNLRQVKPDCKSMISTVSDLAVKVGRQNLFRQVKPGHPSPMMDQKACEVRVELESTGATLSKGNVPNALKHAEAALLLLG
jgi:hypothetical protein